jgi:hypothetical protein
MKCRCGLQPGCRCGLQQGCRRGFFLTDFALLFATGGWVAQMCVQSASLPRKGVTYRFSVERKLVLDQT